MQIGYDNNYTDKSFLEMNANLMRRDLLKVMKDSVSISQYLCIVALVVLVKVHTLESSLDENSLLLLELSLSLLASGFLIFLLTEEKMPSLSLLLRYIVSISFFTTGLYILAPIYQTLTRSIISDPTRAVTVSLLLLHFFLHECSGSTIRAPGALKSPNLTSCIASFFVASRLPSRLHVFAVMLFSLQVFLFTPLVTLYQEILIWVASSLLLCTHGFDALLYLCAAQTLLLVLLVNVVSLLAHHDARV